MAQGAIRGVSEDGILSFVGIPYATINTTALRCKTAGTAPTWRGVRQLHRERNSCSSSASESEDCLQLDVHAPHGPVTNPWPVMVWIQSGPGQYHPKTLAKQGLMIVMVNYRSGALGFLCLNNEKISGNAGLKDLVLALKWVRDNVAAFRGNPDKVTIAGQGYGAALVEALLISQMAKGLYHGAILQSGSILCPWAFNYDAETRANALVASITDSDDAHDITDAINRVKAADLLDKSKKLNFPYFPFGVCVEKAVKNEKALLTEAPIKLLKKINSNIPMMVGYNDDEGYIFASYFKRIKVLRKLRKDVSFLLPDELIFRSEKNVRRVARQIKETYFKKNISMRALLSFHRDAYYINHIHRSVRLHSATNRALYFYQFTYKGDLGVDEEDDLRKNGAAHSDELGYLFPDDGRHFSGDDQLVHDNIVKLWSNFVKFLKPTPSEGTKWEPVRATQVRLMDINTQLLMKHFSHSKNMQMWDDIYDKYYYTRYN